MRRSQLSPQWTDVHYAADNDTVVSYKTLSGAVVRPPQNGRSAAGTIHQARGVAPRPDAVIVPAPKSGNAFTRTVSWVLHRGASQSELKAERKALRAASGKDSSGTDHAAQYARTGILPLGRTALIPLQPQPGSRAALIADLERLR
jgi:hypothetical protein